MKRLILLILVFAGTVHAQYNTSFPSPPAPENPIAEGGKWINGRTNGTSWGNVITDSHGAHGEPQAQQSAFADYTAVLSGTWASGQTACGTVYIDPTLTRTSSNYEIEVRVNVTISPGSITGYEFNYSMDNNGNQYWGAVRWNGAVGNFTGFTGFSTPTALANGDILCGSHISGTLTFTLTRSGTQLQSQSVPDTQQGGAVYTGGSPGMGFFNGGGPVADNAKFGFSAWSTPTAGGSGGGANTYTASSCQQGDVNEVINGSGGITTPIVPHNAVDGDTIIIPAGTCTWTSAIVVPANKRISIIGNGTPNTQPSQYGIALSAINTHITHGGFSMTPIYDSSNYLSRISTIDFEPATGAGAPIVVNGTCAASGCPNLRLDNLYFPTAWSALGLSDDAVAVISNVFGVADHNTAGDVAPTTGYLDFTNLGHGTWLSSTGAYGDLSWASPPSVGTAMAFYLENNTFNYALGTDTDIPSGTPGGGGARFVCRFNNAIAINDFGVCSGHGTDTTGRPRGVMQWEGYYNIGVCPAWPNGIECNSAWPARSGWGYSFGNSFSNGTGTMTSLTGFDNQRTWRGSSPWGECDGQSPWDTNDGVTYFAGTVGSFTEVGTGSGNWTMTVSGTSPGWSFNQWIAYTFFDDTHGTATMVGGSGANTLNTVNVCDTCIGWQTPGGNPPQAGDTFHIYRSTVCMDQANRGAGVQLTGLLTPAPVGPINQVLQPSYQANDIVPSSVGSNMGSETPNMRPNVDFFMEVPNQVAQTSSTFPFNGAIFSQPIQSWTCNGGTGHCVVTVASTAGLQANGPVIDAGSTAGAHVNVDGSYTIIGTPTGTTYTINNVGGYTDSASAGGSANGAGTGHGTLANRPTTCSTGVGYFATNQGTWNTVSGGPQGELFKCTAPNTWTLAYTPYTYPHPLVSGTAPPPAAAVSFNPSSLNFGSLAVGNVSATQTFTIENTGTANLTYGPYSVSNPPNASFNVVGGTNPCPISSTLTPSSSCAITVQVTANSGSGVMNGTFNLPSNAPGSPQTVPLSVTVTSATQPGINISPSSNNYGNVMVGTSASQTFTITSTTSANLVMGNPPATITGTNVSNFTFQSQGCTAGLSIPQSQTCLDVVVFTPSATGALSAQLNIFDNVTGSPQIVLLSGTGTIPIATLSPTSVGFGNVIVKQAPEQTVTLQNTGTATLSISSIVASGSPAFTQTNNCGASLAAGLTCSIQVSFAPLATGTASGVITITDNAATSPQTVPLSGSGILVPSTSTGVAMQGVVVQ